MSDPDLRPEPDALLASSNREGRGQLKIFLGAAPGVGKTYAMLEDARRRISEGVDVLAGVIETHGRAETEAMLRDMPVLPRRAVYYQGRILSEQAQDVDIRVMQPSPAHQPYNSKSHGHRRKERDQVRRGVSGRFCEFKKMRWAFWIDGPLCMPWQGIDLFHETVYRLDSSIFGSVPVANMQIHMG